LLEGENVLNFAATFANAGLRLEPNNHDPYDFAHIFYRGLKSGTVELFNRFLENLYIGDDPVLSDLLSLKDLAIKTYNKFYTASLWLATQSSGASAFTMGRHDSSKGRHDSSDVSKRWKNVDRTAPKSGESEV
jgi:hypothetical protein